MYVCNKKKLLVHQLLFHIPNSNTEHFFFVYFGISLFYNEQIVHYLNLKVRKVLTLLKILQVSFMIRVEFFLLHVLL